MAAIVILLAGPLAQHGAPAWNGVLARWLALTIFGVWIVA